MIFTFLFFFSNFCLKKQNKKQTKKVLKIENSIDELIECENMNCFSVSMRQILALNLSESKNLKKILFENNLKKNCFLVVHQSGK